MRRSSAYQGRHRGGNLKQGLPDNQFLCTKTEFKNFELTAKCKLIGEKTPTAAFEFRSQRVPKSSEMTGYQADMDAKWWGNLYEESHTTRFWQAQLPSRGRRSSIPTAGTTIGSAARGTTSSCGSTARNRRLHRDRQGRPAKGHPGTPDPRRRSQRGLVQGHPDQKNCLPSDMRPKFLYFDLGKVLVDFSVERMLEQMAGVAGISAEQVRAAVFNQRPALGTRDRTQHQ